MHLETRELELMELAALLVDTNKQFTDSPKAKRPHAELVELYAQIKEIYSQINSLKEQELVAA